MRLAAGGLLPTCPTPADKEDLNQMLFIGRLLGRARAQQPGVPFYKTVPTFMPDETTVESYCGSCSSATDDHLAALLVSRPGPAATIKRNGSHSIVLATRSIVLRVLFLNIHAQLHANIKDETRPSTIITLPPKK